MAARWAAYLARWLEHLHGVQIPDPPTVEDLCFGLVSGEKARFAEDSPLEGAGFRTLGPPVCWLLQRLEHVPRLARRRHQPVAILGQQQPLGDEAIHGLGQSRRPGVA